MDSKRKNTLENKFSTVGESLYKVLEISKQAGVEDIKQSYKKLALKYHPDKNPGNEEAAEMFQEITRAHAILTNEKRRKLYDKYGSVGLNIADHLGEHNVDSYLFINTPLTQCFATFCFLTTFCCCCCCFCCCFCCNFCCSKSGADDSKKVGSMQFLDSIDEDKKTILSPHKS